MAHIGPFRPNLAHPKQDGASEIEVALIDNRVVAGETWLYLVLFLVLFFNCTFDELRFDFELILAYIGPYWPISLGSFRPNLAHPKQDGASEIEVALIDNRVVA